MNNQECKIRPQIVNINSNEPLFYPYSVKMNKCIGSCNNVNDRYAKLFVPDIIKTCPILFIKFLFFHQIITLQKLWKMFFISSKKLFLFSRYSNFCNFFPSFPHFPDSKGQMELE